jgi:uncharacterized membrane protein (DUF4010 family)
MTELESVFLRLGVAAGLGLLVGLQREREGLPLAGIRTFPLITVLGALGALLAPSLGGWVLGAGMLALGAVVVMSRWIRERDPAPGASGAAGPPGITTEVAALLMFGVGAYLVVGALPVGIAVGGGVAVLLQLKAPLHRFAQTIGEADIRAIMQFVLITLVILPVLPNHPLGADRLALLHVINPQKIWLLVVLVVGIGLLGYVAHKALGERVGLILAGVLGGMISSTVTTVSYAKQTRGEPGRAAGAALVIAIASAVMYARIPVLIGAVDARQLAAMAPPLLGMGALLTLVSVALFFLPRGSAGQPVAHGNPSELKTALLFAALFAAVLLTTAAARQYLGGHSLYAIAALAGLTDVDAITLTTTQMVHGGEIAAGQGWRVILTASLSNFLFKGVMVVLLADRKLVGRVAVIFGLALAAGAGLLVFWPY